MSAPAVSVDEWIVGTLEHPPKENLSYFASRVLCLLRIWEWRKELVQVIWGMAPEPLWAPDCAIEGYALVLIQVLRGCMCLVEFSASLTFIVFSEAEWKLRGKRESRKGAWELRGQLSLVSFGVLRFCWSSLELSQNASAPNKFFRWCP